MSSCPVGSPVGSNSLGKAWKWVRHGCSSLWKGNQRMSLGRERNYLRKDEIYCY
jgi:hypothetical protein